MSKKKLDGYQKILRRVQQLLAMAADVSSPNEAAIAAERAEKLMRQYNIDNAAVLVAELDDGDVSTEAVDHVNTIYGGKLKAKGRKSPTWVNWLAVSAAYLCEAEVEWKHRQFYFHGVGGDAELSSEMFKYLLSTVNRLANEFGGKRGEKSAFRMGAAAEIQARCKKIKTEREQEFEQVSSSGKELIILKHALIEQNKGKMGYTNSRASTSDEHAYAMGRHAGRDVGLNNQLNKGQERLK